MLFPKRYWFSFPFLFFFPFSFISHLSSPSPFSLFTIGFYSFLNKFAISDYLGERDTKEEKGGEGSEERSQLLNISFPFLPSFWLSNYHLELSSSKCFPLTPAIFTSKVFFSFLYFFFCPYLFLSYFPHLSSSFFVFFEKQIIQELLNSFRNWSIW